MVHRPRQKQLGRGPLQLEVQAPPWQLGVLLVACEETSATGEILPDGHPVLQPRSVQSCASCNYLNIRLRRVVRLKSLIDSEVEEQVESLFNTRTPARWRSLFDQFCLSRPACRSPRNLLLAFGGWSSTGSGDTAVTGPSPDILIFNPASRFEAGHII